MFSAVVKNSLTFSQLRPVLARIRAAETISLVLWACIGIGVAGRFVTFPGQPLWFDETFTGVIATRPDFASFYEWISLEIGGPIYYSFLWIWQLFAGASNNALRIPSLIFSLISIVVVIRSAELTNRTRLIFAALMSLSTASYLQASEARSYALVVLLCSLQLFAFIRLLRKPSTPLAMIWVGISAAGMLTHYHVGFVSLMQGLIYLGYCKSGAVKTWPAILLLFPVAIWLKMQLDFLGAYAAPANNWYALLKFSDLAHIVPLALRFGLIGYLLCAIAVYFGTVWCTRRGALQPIEQDGVPLLAAISGLLAVVAVVAMGMLVPSFSPRYLYPASPAVLLGVSLALAQLGQVSRKGLIYALVMLAASSVSFCLQLLFLPVDRNPLAFERASEWIMANGDPKRAVFYWDNPTGDISSIGHLRDVGGFFFERAGRHPRIVIPRMQGNAVDPNKELVALAGKDGQGAIIWLADKGVAGTRAIVFREKLTQDPKWHCGKFGYSMLEVIACLPK